MKFGTGEHNTRSLSHAKFASVHNFQIWSDLQFLGRHGAPITVKFDTEEQTICRCRMPNLSLICEAVVV